MFELTQNNNTSGDDNTALATVSPPLAHEQPLAVMMPSVPSPAQMLAIPDQTTDSAETTRPAPAPPRPAPMPATRQDTKLMNDQPNIPGTPVTPLRILDIPIITDIPKTNDIEELYRLLGPKTVLIPVHWGTKKPMRAEWQNTILEATRASDYARDLAFNNVGVLVGENSDNIIDIDCDDTDFMNEFVKVNVDPCSKTLQSKGERGCHYWFRMKGDYPAMVERIESAEGVHVGEFRGGKGNSTIAGRHPSGCDYQIINKVPVLEIGFADLKWPEGYIYPWVISDDEQIARRVGPPFEENKGKASRINAAYFAELVISRTHVVFEEGESLFYQYDPDTGLWVRVTDSRMAEAAWKVCLEWIDFQDPAIVDSLKILFTQRARTDIVAMMKSKAASSNFFTSGPTYEMRDKYFHCVSGMVRCMVEVGGVNPTFLTLPVEERYRSRFRHPCQYVDDPKCPKFDRLLESAFGEENVPHVLKFLGYLLIDGNPGQHMIVIKGPSGSGKSQLALVMKGLFADRSWGELRTSQLEGRFEIGSFADKRLVYGPDVSKNFFSVEGARNLKALTGGDPMEPEMKFANERLSMFGDKHVLVTTNDVLRLAPGEDAGAWCRRLIILEARPADRNALVVKLGAKILEQEKDAVFTKLMNAGYVASVELVEHGMMQVPEQYRLGVSSAIIIIGDPAQWVGACVSDGGTTFSTNELYMAYSNWCASRGETPMSSSSFEKILKRLMEDLGHESSHSLLRNGSYCNGYRGLEVVL